VLLLRHLPVLVKEYKIVLGDDLKDSHPRVFSAYIRLYTEAFDPSP